MKTDCENKYVEVTITLNSNLSSFEINTILEKIFYDGEYFEDFEDVDWKFKKIKDLHTQAIELMEKLIKKYKLKDEMSSLDEFLYENVYKFSDKDIDEIVDLIDKFNE